MPFKGRISDALKTMHEKIVMFVIPWSWNLYSSQLMGIEKSKSVWEHTRASWVMKEISYLKPNEALKIS